MAISFQTGFLALRGTPRSPLLLEAERKWLRDSAGGIPPVPGLPVWLPHLWLWLVALLLLLCMGESVRLDQPS